MSFTGLPRGRRKAINTIRITHDGAGTSTIYKDGVLTTTIAYTDVSGWQQLESNTTTTINFIEIFDSVGETARIGTGAAFSELDLFQIVPGGNGLIPVRIDSGTRIAIRALVTPGANTETVINFYD